MCEKVKYEKLPLHINEQCKRLQDRGLILNDLEYAKSILSSIGYYRLSAYFLPFQEDKEKHLFYSNVKFEQVVNMYKFDCMLRCLLINPIESAEVQARTRLTYYLSLEHNDAFCYLNKNLYSAKFLGEQLAREDIIRECRHLPETDITYIWEELRKQGYITKKGNIQKRFSQIENVNIDNITLEEKEAVYKCFDKSPYDIFMGHIANSVIESQEVFVRHFRTKYFDEYLPLWMVTEIVSLGQISRLFTGLNSENKQNIAKLYNLPHRTIGQWLHSLTYLRNMCAHHSRLWNRKLEIAPTRPRNLPENEIWSKQLFSLLVVLKYLVSDSFDWNNFIQSLNALLDENKFVDIKAMGFPDDWEKWLTNK